jgi:hypothetical protein
MKTNVLPTDSQCLPTQKQYLPKQLCVCWALVLLLVKIQKQ